MRVNSYRESKRTYFKTLSLLVKRKVYHCDFEDVSRTRVACMLKKVSLQKDFVDSYTEVLGEKHS